MMISMCFLGNCQWAPFAEWTPCSQSCGGGLQTRSRIQLQSASNGGLACAGLGTEEQECNLQACPGKIDIS